MLFVNRNAKALVLTAPSSSCWCSKSLRRKRNATGTKTGTRFTILSDFCHRFVGLHPQLRLKSTKAKLRKFPGDSRHSREPVALDFTKRDHSDFLLSSNGNPD